MGRLVSAAVYLVLAVFTPGYDQIVDRIPVHLHDNTFVCFPLELFPADLEGFD